KGGAERLQDALEVLERAVELRAEVAETSQVAGSVGRYLAGDVRRATPLFGNCSDGIRPDGQRCAFWVENFDHSSSSGANTLTLNGGRQPGPGSRVGDPRGRCGSVAACNELSQVRPPHEHEGERRRAP